VHMGHGTENFGGQVGTDGYSRNDSVAVWTAQKLIGKVSPG
jgi:hypothetical protein